MVQQRQITRYIVIPFLFFLPLITIIFTTTPQRPPLPTFDKSKYEFYNENKSQEIFKKIQEPQNSDLCDITKSHSNTSQSICHYIETQCDVTKYRISQRYYCSDTSSSSIGTRAAFIGFYISIIAVIFLSFGIITSNHLYPNLETISLILIIPSKLSGLILLAIGNAIPDISTLYHCISTNAIPLAIGELLGSCNFILGVVIGSMGVLKRFKVPKEAFVKDFVGFSGLVFISLLFLYDFKLRIWECFAMVGLYLVYIWHSVISVRSSDPKDVLEQLDAEEGETSPAVVDEETRLLDFEAEDYRESSVGSGLTTFYKYTRTPQVLSTLETVDMLSLDSGEYADWTDQAELAHQQASPWLYLLKYMNYKECLVEYPSSWKTPLVSFFNLTIPTQPKFLYEDSTVSVPEEFEHLRLFKLKLFKSQGTLLTLLLIQNTSYLGELSTMAKLMVLASALLCSLAVAHAISSAKSRNLFSFIVSTTGFIASMFFIYFLSSQLITILQNLALIFGISESLLGLTILSLCNSISDLITNLTLSQLGLSLVGINASFGSILIYFGIGIGFNSLLVMLSQGKKSIELKVTDLSFLVSSLGLVSLLLVYLVGIPLNSWFIDWKLGSMTIGIWLAVFLLNVYVS